MVVQYLGASYKILLRYLTTTKRVGHGVCESAFLGFNIGLWWAIDGYVIKGFSFAPLKIKVMCLSLIFLWTNGFLKVMCLSILFSSTLFVNLYAYVDPVCWYTWSHSKGALHLKKVGFYTTLLGAKEWQHYGVALIFCRNVLSIIFMSFVHNCCIAFIQI